MMKGDAQGLPLAQMTVYGVKDFKTNMSWGFYFER